MIAQDHEILRSRPVPKEPHPSEFSVVGEAVNLASRLQGVAEDGEVVICEVTADALKDLRGEVGFESRHVNLKGFGAMDVHVLKIKGIGEFLARRI